MLDKRTTVAFCKNSSGITTYIRINNVTDILLYPDTKKVQPTLVCLGKYMPFYDKNIEFLYAERGFYNTSMYQEFNRYYSLNSVIGKSYLRSYIQSQGIGNHFIEFESELHLKLLPTSLFIYANRGEEWIVFKDDDSSVGIIKGNSLKEIQNMFKGITIVVLNNSRTSENLIQGLLKPHKLILIDKNEKQTKKLSSEMILINLYKDIYHSFKK